MGYRSENNWTKIDKLAYQLYSDYMTHIAKVDEYAADWWFVNHKNEPQYKKFYTLAERKYKIEKIKNG